MHIVLHNGDMIGQRRSRAKHLKQRLDMIHALGHARIHAFAGLEFAPKRHQRRTLGQQAKQPLGSRTFSSGQRRPVMGQMDRVIAAIDLDQIMDQDHGDSPVRGPEHHRIKRHMPAVLGAVLGPRQIHQHIGAVDGFQPVRLDQKRKTPLQRRFFFIQISRGPGQSPGPFITHRVVSVNRRRT